MNEETARNLPQEEVEETAAVVLPPLTPQQATPAGSVSDEPISPPAESPDSPPPTAETSPPEGELPAQEAEEEKVFQRPRTIKDLRKGMTLEGKVTSVAIYGAFVDIGVGREGLVHISQLSDRPVSSPTDVVRIGDMVTVRVLDVDPRSRRISLTMRQQVEPGLDRKKLGELKPGMVTEGTVTSLARFGAFVDVGVGRDGLIPNSQVVATDPNAAEEVHQARDLLHVGERVKVRVTDVDPKSGRIRLSMRNVYDGELLEQLRPDMTVKGRVTSLAPFGAFVDLGVGKDGLVHISEMGEAGIRHPQEVLRVGQEVEVRILEVDPETQRISLSMQLEAEAEWAASLEEEGEEEAFPEEATLEDLVARFSMLRPAGRSQAHRQAHQAERQRQAVREAQRRALEELREKE